MSDSTAPQLPPRELALPGEGQAPIEDVQASPTPPAPPSLGSTTRPVPCLRGFSLSPSPQAGVMIGERYLIEGFLGEGGTATVYLARDLSCDELVVIKSMKPVVAATPELRERFLFEARALKRVDHPAVVRILDIGEPENEPPYLTLEALRGESLGDYLKRESSVPVELAISLLSQITCALEAVHSAGMVHRDVKPDNIFLVGPVGAPESIKVLDFGMALFSEDGHDESSTSILGTVQYMAPEQILVEPVDARTDIYSLGVVMFRMITGHLPFDAHSKNDLLRHQLFSPVPPASWLHDDISPALERIVRQATLKTPAARFANMNEMRAALAEVSLSDEAPHSARLSSFTFSTEPDVYHPVTERGRHAASVLSTEFGIYSRPHHPVQKQADESR